MEPNLTRSKNQMSKAQEIRAALQAIRANPALLASIRAERDTLVSDVMLSPNGGREMVNGSGNGMAFTAQVTMSKRDRLAMLQSIIEFYDAGTSPSSWAKTGF